MTVDEFDTNLDRSTQEFPEVEDVRAFSYGGSKRLSFRTDADTLILVYTPDDGAGFIDEKFNEAKGEEFVFTVKRLFHFNREDALDLNSENKSSRSFRFGHIDRENREYYRVNDGVMNIRNGLLLHKSVEVDPEWFAPIISYKYGVINVFDKIDKLVNEEIIIGGPHPRAIPENEMRSIVGRFPNETEMSHYYNSRVQHLLEDYFGTMTDSEEKLQKFLARKEKQLANKRYLETKEQAKAISKYEVEKYEYLHDRLLELLKDESISEKTWESEILKLILLIYPRYVSVIRQMRIIEYLTNPKGKPTPRYPDLALVDADGHIDLIEIKKPSSSSIFRSVLDHDNAIPSLSLTKTVMQMEKYILYLQKGGYALEKQLSKKYKKELPNGMALRIVNPKGILIVGRKDFDASFETDFEVIRRKYANIVDILTYDDLLDRVKNIISSIKKRT